MPSDCESKLRFMESQTSIILYVESQDIVCSQRIKNRIYRIADNWQHHFTRRRHTSRIEESLTTSFISSVERDMEHLCDTQEVDMSVKTLCDTADQIVLEIDNMW